MLFKELSLNELRRLDRAIASVSKENLENIYWESFLNWTEGAEIHPDNLEDQIKFLRKLSDV